MPRIRLELVCLLLAVTLLSSSAQNDAVVALVFSSCVQYTYSVTEGNSLNLCAVLLYINGSATLMNGITVQFVPVNGTAQYPSDFPYVIYYATFPAGTSQGLQQCVNINTVNDMDVENNEAFTVNLLAANSSAVTIGDRSGGKTATITINDNDVSVFTLDGNYTTIEGTSAFQVCAVLYSGTPTISGAVTLRFTPNAMTATTSDYSPTTTNTVNVNAGVVVGGNVCFTVTIIDDILVENNETFIITISAGAKSSVMTPRIISYITIIDNDVAIVGLISGNQIQSTETNISISVCAVITNNIQLTSALTIQVNTVDITTTSGLDYLPPSSPVSFSSTAAIGATSCANFMVLQDSVVENNELISIYLKSTTSQIQVLPTAANFTFTIIEDGDTVLIGFSSIASNITEGVNAQICAQIKSGSIGISVSVSITTTTLGSAIANVDYVPLTLAPIVFNPGSSSSVNSTSCCTLVILDDDAVENDETISLSMSASTPVNIQQSTSFAVVTIIEGTADNISVGLGSSIRVTEGLNLTAIVCATILRGSLQVSVGMLAFTSNITATPSVDYETKSATLTFTSGKTVGDSVCITIGIYNDLIVENPEQFTVNLQSVDSRAVVATGQGQITVTIYDDPADVITLGFQNPLYRTTETSSSVSVCILMLSGQLGKDVFILVATKDQTAIGGVDYVPLNTTIIFRSGMAAGSSLCVSIGLLDDIVVEANQESFLVSINGTDPAAIIEAATTPIYIHEDSDDVVVIGFQYSSYTVGNTGTNLTLCTTMYSGTTQRLIAVFATTVSKEAIESVDYVGINARELDFPSGSTQNSTACFSMVIINDTDIELPETFSVILTQSDIAVQLSSQYATAVVTIL